MIFTVFEVLANVAECLLMSRVLILWFPFRSRQHWFLKALLLFSFMTIADCVGTFSFPFSNEIFLASSFLLILFTFSIIFLNGSIFEKIFVSILIYLLNYLVNLPVLTLLSKISELSILEFTAAHNTERIFCLILTKLLYFLVTQILLYIKKKGKYNFHKNEWILIICVLGITLLISFFILLIMDFPAIRDLAYVVVALLLSSLDVIVLSFIQKIHITSQDKLEKEQLKLQLQQLEQKYQEISILRHDFRNSIQCVQDLIASANYKEALAYTEKWKKRKINLLPSVVQTSSSVIDVVMNGKASEALTYGIEVSLRMTALIPESLAFDMSVLLSNLLDNAIEASQKNHKNPQIITTISEINGYYRIVIRNQVTESVLKKIRCWLPKNPIQRNMAGDCVLYEESSRNMMV